MERKVRFEPATQVHVLIMAPKVRSADQLEIWAQVQMNPQCALLLSIAGPGRHYAALLNDEPVAIFGVVPDDKGGAAIWCIGTDAIPQNADLFRQYFDEWFQEFQRQYKHLYNWVDARNEVSLRWAQSVGFKIKPAMPYGALQLPFHYVEWRAS